MEKNGAISNETPCCRGGCKSFIKKSEQHPDAIARQKQLFPETDEAANQIDQDITKKAIETVADCSNKCQ